MHSHITIPIENEVVTAELFTPETEVTASMLFCHGWTSSNTKYLPFAEELSKQGVLSLAINLRGHGDSAYSLENYSRHDHLNDVLSAIDYLKKYSNGPIIILGKSYGGYLSAIASSMRAINYLIISQPALYPDNDFSSPNAALVRKNPDIFRSTSEDVSSNRALSAVKHYSNPLLIIESEHDEEVFDTPKLYIQASEKNTKRTTLIINDTDHPLSRPEWRTDYFQKITMWLKMQKII
jgi:esterase/lipase